MRQTDDQRGAKALTGAKRVWYILNNSVDTIMFAGLLFLVFGLPVITIPLSMSGMMAVFLTLIRGKACSTWNIFWSAFRNKAAEKIGVFLLSAFLTAGGYFWALIMGYPVFAEVFVLIVFSFLFTLSVYFFICCELFELPFKNKLRIASFLTFKEIFRTLMVLGFIVLFLFLLYWLFPRLIFILVLLVFPLMQLWICNSLYESVQKYFPDTAQREQTP